SHGSLGAGGPCRDDAGMSAHCCSPPRAGHPAAGPGDTRTHERSQSPGVHVVPQANIPAGAFAMGDGYGDGNRPDGEDPVHLVHVSAFDIDTTSVTVADFARFVDATGYRTEAETFGYSAVFHLVVAADAADIVGRPPGTPWWVGVRGADWRHPDGPRSDTAG